MDLYREVGAGTKPVSSNQNTEPLNIAGRFSSSHNTDGAVRVILVGILSSSSRIPSLSESQSELHPEIPQSCLMVWPNPPKRGCSSPSPPFIVVVVYVEVIRHVELLLGLARPTPLQSRRESHGFVDSVPYREGH